MSIQNNTLPDNPQIQVIKSGKTGLFTNYIWKAIPLAFDESMSYYETLCGLLHYLKNVVIPTVNNNADAVSELQNLYIELKSYVDDYFTNLDVQEEINNKLDAMVEDGTLETIINQEIFGDINDAIDLINSEKSVLIGDSYIVGVNPDGDTLTPWGDIFKNLMGLDDNNCNIIGEAGAGFLRAGTYNHTFLQLLQSQINTISNKNYVKNVILCGGYNDNTYSVNDIKDAINTFVNYCHQQFPNATVYIGCIGYRYEISSSGSTTRANIAQSVYPAYANNVSSNIRKYVYLNGVENILKSLPKSYMYVDNAHPNQQGQNALGQGIYQAFKTGYVNSYSNGSMILTNSEATAISGTPNVKKCDNMCQITVPQITVDYAEETAKTIAVGSLVEIADYSSNGFIGGINNDYNIAPCTVSIQDYEKGRHTMSGYIIFTNEGKIKLWTWHTVNTSSSGQSLQFNKVKQIQVFRCKCEMPLLVS